MKNAEHAAEHHHQTEQVSAVATQLVDSVCGMKVDPERTLTAGRPSVTKIVAAFPIEEIGDLLSLWSDRERSSAEAKSLALTRAEQLGDKARRLEAMRAALLDLAGQCRGDGRPACPIIDQLAAR